ncbi:MCE family protein [Mycobacterium koreense]|uniref:MCE family protein n=1 Tax=Mycolicibacillus koreensis TaxID=1069220 RepID=A0A7I7SGB4_9MYCO|nr:MlaD family protein [Mycolicibacillus koreensis]MCV7248311.1 MCE family protein [Mycolicibacillus koreensis]ODR09519.1 mammalian cell entry protein [Mycolicibacillus koreensis]OSC33757.1 MCE family protein [Mycolicibacillus koreensis]BBY55249.1 putative Mce family protein [Mycolicibacillus koreensis]
MPPLLDVDGRGASRPAMRVKGLIVAVAITLVAGLLYQMAIGRFDNKFTLTVVADTIGEGLAPGAEVKFRGLPIGTVKSLESTGYNQQRMLVELDPRQAHVLTTDTRAQFTSSNVFGSAAVELVSSGDGEALRPGQTLVMETGTEAASITGLLRQGQKIGKIFDSPEVNHILAVFKRHTDLTEPVARSIIDFARILADSQTVPFSETLAVLAGLVDGLNDFVPLVSLLNDLLDGLKFLSEPDGPQRTTRVLGEIGQLLSGVGELIARHLPWLTPVITSIMNLAVPSMYLFGSLAPAYDRLSGLIDRTSAAFPFQNDRVRMQIELIMDTAPGLASALPEAPREGR